MTQINSYFKEYMYSTSTYGVYVKIILAYLWVDFKTVGPVFLT